MGRFVDVLLTVDFDRTLTAPDSTIPERNLQAIREFMAQGGVFTMNTGRSVPMFRRFLEVVPTNAPLLLYNGSGDYDAGTRSFASATPIPLDPKAFLTDLIERFPQLHVELQGEDAHYLFRKDAGWEAYCIHNHCDWAYASLDAIPMPFLKVALYGQFREPTVASMYQGTEQELALFAQATEYIQRTYGAQTECFRACARILDIHAKGVSKHQAAKNLKQRLGRKILVCVGDADNDIPMLDGADYAFCPADGVVAHRYPNVCPCAEGAVADVIYKKIPEIVEK